MTRSTWYRATRNYRPGARWCYNSLNLSRRLSDNRGEREIFPEGLASTAKRPYGGATMKSIRGSIGMWIAGAVVLLPASGPGCAGGRMSRGEEHGLLRSPLGPVIEKLWEA